MVERGGPSPDPTAIGDIAAPPFVRLPDPATLFARRAARFAFLAEGSAVGPYLRFLAGLAGAQHAVATSLGPLPPPDPETLLRAREFAMPPLDRARAADGAAVAATLDRLFAAAAAGPELPPAAAAALDRVGRLDPDARGAMVANVLDDAPAVETLAEHVYVAAGLQVHFARFAAGLHGDRLVPVGEGACPACGGPPAVSLVVGWPGAHGSRFCACALCATLWNVVRVKCTLCGSTAGIGYQHVEGGPDTAKAETCSTCGCWVKILAEHRDPAIEPIADDVAWLGLDLKMREGRYRRGGVDPYLAGY